MDFSTFQEISQLGNGENDLLQQYFFDFENEVKKYCHKEFDYIKTIDAWDDSIEKAIKQNKARINNNYEVIKFK